MKKLMLTGACALAWTATAHAQPPPYEDYGAPMPDVEDVEDYDDEDSGLAIAVDAELYAGGAWESTADESGTAFDLDRGEVGTRLAYGDSLLAEIRLETVRTVMDPAVADGESALLVRGKRAWLAWRDRPHRGSMLEVRGGLIPDPWIEAIESGYELRALRPTIGEATGLLDTADLGLAAVVAAKTARLQLSVTNGEGHTQVEQNRGKDVSGILSVRAPRIARTIEIATHLYGRSGSAGEASGRNHRLGVALTVDGPKHGGGMELLSAWGVAGDPGVKSVSAGFWGYATLTRSGGLATRLDVLTTSDFGAELQGTEMITTVALWRDLVPRGDARVRDFGVRAYLAAQFDRIPEMATQLPTASTMDTTRVMLILAATAHEDI